MRSSWRLMTSWHRAVMGQRIRFGSLLFVHQNMIPPGKGIKNLGKETSEPFCSYLIHQTTTREIH